jgi:cytochrome c-type biogenesis protein
MIESLFISLARAVEGAPVVALTASFIWGILSIILSPCHLASIPLIVAFINGQGQIPVRRAFALSTLFAAGILLSIAAIGAVTAGMGRIMGDLGGWANYAVAAIFLVIGLHLLEAIPLPFNATGPTGWQKRGALAAFLLGAVFGIALGPCTFAFMAPMLGVAFRLAGSDVLYGALLILAYGVGHCAVIVLAGTFTEVVEDFLHWNEKSRGTIILKKICGVLVIAGGLYLIYTTR